MSTPQIRATPTSTKRISALPRTLVVAAADSLALDTAAGTKSVQAGDLHAAADHVRWVEPYSSGTTYEKNDMVRDGDWTLIANKQTTDPAAPQSVGTVGWVEADSPTWGSRVTAGPAVAGVGLSGSASAFQIAKTRYWLNDVTATAHYLPFVKDGSGIYTLGTELLGTELVSAGWYESSQFAAYAAPGSDLTFGMILRKEGGGSETLFNFAQGWEGSSAAAPLDGNANHSGANSIVRLSNEDSTGTSVTANTGQLAPGSILKTVDALDSTKFYEYLVMDRDDKTGYTECAVALTAVGSGGAPSTTPSETPLLVADWTDFTFGGSLDGTTEPVTATVDVAQDRFLMRIPGYTTAGVRYRLRYEIRSDQAGTMYRSHSANWGAGGTFQWIGPTLVSDTWTDVGVDFTPINTQGMLIYVLGMTTGDTFQLKNIRLEVLPEVTVIGIVPDSGNLSGVVNLGTFTSRPALDGVYYDDSVDVATNDCEGVDLELQEFTLSTDWDVVATSAGGAGGGSGGGGGLPDAHGSTHESGGADPIPELATHLSATDNPHGTLHSVLADLSTSGHPQSVIGGRPASSTAALDADQAWQDARIAALEAGSAYAYDSIVGMKAAAVPADGTLVALRGYYAPDDDGGGFFLYESANAAADDGGSVIAPGSGVGRYVRSKIGMARPEWFGAKGDGVIGVSVSGYVDNPVTGTDDIVAIEKCIELYGEMFLAEKVYCLGNSLGGGNGATLTPNSTTLVIEGTSKETSVLAFLSGNHAVASTNCTYMFYLFTTPQERVEVRNAQIYLNQRNFRRLDTGALKSVAFLNTKAATVIVEDVVLRGYGRAEANTETFVVYAHGTATGQTVFRRIEFRGQAYDPDSGDYVYPEVTYLLAYSRRNVLIADNTFKDEKIISGVTPAENHFISFHGCHGFRITGNTWIDCDGVYLYADNGDCSDGVIQGNTASGGDGVFLDLINAFANGTYHNIDVSGNLVELNDSAGTSLMRSRIGVLLEATQTGRNTNNFRNIAIHDNKFSIGVDNLVWGGQGVLLRADPALLGDSFVGVTITNNVFDVRTPAPAVGADSVIPLLDSPNAITGTPKNMFATGAANGVPELLVKCDGNVTHDGRRVTPWAFTSTGPPNWGMFEPSVANSEIAYEADQLRAGYFGIEQHRLWQQFDSMGTVTDGAFANVFYLFGHGISDVARPGPKGRNTRFLFGMSNRTDWKVILPVVSATGYEAVAGTNICDQWHDLEMTWLGNGHAVTLLGYVDDGATLAEIGTYTVPGHRPLHIKCRPNRTTTPGAPSWNIDSDEHILHGDIDPNFIPKSSGGVLADSGLQDLGSEIVSNATVRPGADVTLDLGSDIRRWRKIYANALRLAGATSATSLSTTVDGDIVGSDIDPNFIPKSSGGVLADSNLHDLGTEVISNAAVRPGADGTLDLGSAARRWAKLYAAALQLTGLPSAPTLATDPDGNLIEGPVPTTGSGNALVVPIWTVDGVNLGNSAIDQSGSGQVRIDSDLIPKSDNAYGLGAVAARWVELHCINAFVAGGIRSTGLANTPYLAVDGSGDFTAAATPGDVTSSAAVVGRLALFSGSTKNIADAPMSSTGTEIVANVDLRPISTGADLGTDQNPWTHVFARGLRAADIPSEPYLATNGSGDIVPGTVPPSHQWGRRHVKWSSTSGSTLVTTGAYAEWPAMVSDYGWLVDFAGNTFTVTHGGLYIFSVNGTVDNMGTAGGAMDDLRITFTIDGTTNYESIFVSNTGTGSFTNAFSVDRAFSLTASATVKVRYKFAVGAGTPHVYSLNASATQVA